MTTPDLVILYVADPVASADFYAALFGQPPAEASPGFAMFKLPHYALGLWKRDAVMPPPATGSGVELVFHVNDADALHAAWAARGLTIAQPPVTQEFGRSVVALDPDGHRLRGLVTP